MMVWGAGPRRCLISVGRCAGRENTVPTGKTLPDLTDPDEEVRPHRRRHPTAEAHRLPVLNHRAVSTLTR